ncbi:hypothetical protein GY45DRAFT_1436169 [Cubamyces sp. BRFM 1775]|nr:hypothetical protein GY45DRAFT_1436169 [Cubamyces sp. BRFM 1775]
MPMLKTSRQQSMYLSEEYVSGLPEARDEIDQDLHHEAGVDLNEALQVCSNLLSGREGELVSAWADQADGLVTFAALFSAVVTSFIIESYKNLQVDENAIMIALLRQISGQLDGVQPLPGSEVGRAPFEPLPSDVLQNSLLFASLICSLLAAGMGIFYKEWIRQYTLRTPTDPRLLIRVRQHRYLGLCTWKLGAIIGGISIFLQLGVAFFIGALLLFVWKLNLILRLVLSTFVTIWTVVWVGTAFCPTFSSNCPFKSPLAYLIFRVLTLGNYLWRLSSHIKAHSRHADTIHSTLEDWELDAVEEGKARLDAGALCYLLRTYNGDKRAVYVERCIQGLGDAEALKLFEELIRTHPGLPKGATIQNVVSEKLGEDDPAIQRLIDLQPNIITATLDSSTRAPWILGQ